MLLLLLAACPLHGILVSEDTAEDTSSIPDDTSPPDDTGDTGDTDDTDDTGDTATEPVTDFALVLDPDVATMIHATWTDPGSTEAWVEYQVDGADWHTAPSTATGVAVILGVPADTPVVARAAAVVDGDTRYSATAAITTGRLPRTLLVPTVSTWEPDLAYDAEYAMIVVAVGDYTYSPPYWIEIFDRQGQIVWYWQVADNMMSFYPTVSRDGTHIWFEAENIFGVGSGSPTVTRRTLDGRWSTVLDVPNLGEAIAEGPDDAFYFETRRGNAHELSRLDPDGTVTTEWNCSRWFQAVGLPVEYCDMNTCNWDETRDSVLVSQFYTDTVFEIDLGTGQPIRQMGQLDVGEPYTFAPPASMFDYQHNPYWTEADTLLVSTHVVGVSGVQVAAEYTVDDATGTVTRVWAYVSTDLWATQLGEAVRLPNGNTTQGYGQDGAIREVTPDGQVAWQASWPRDGEGYRVIGHLSLIPDLYALNRGP